MTRREYYREMSEYYGDRAREAGARYLESGRSLDKLWAGHFVRVSLFYRARALQSPIANG